MQRTLRVLSLAGLLATGAATAMAAGNDPGGNLNSQSTTGAQTGSQQVPSPATGSSQYTYPQTGRMNPTGMSAQSSQYPAQVGPTGSHDPDATNPNRSSPNGGGGAQDNGGANGTGSGR
jgi:hypothetical protein